MPPISEQHIVADFLERETTRIDRLVENYRRLVDLLNEEVASRVFSSETKHGDFLLNENSRGAAGRNRPLNINSLLKEKISVPDVPAQEMVAKAVHRRIRVLSETAKQIGRLQEYRSALISAAVTGQIDVRTYRPQEAAALCL